MRLRTGIVAALVALGVPSTPGDDPSREEDGPPEVRCTVSDDRNGLPDLPGAVATRTILTAGTRPEDRRPVPLVDTDTGR